MLRPEQGVTAQRVEKPVSRFSSRSTTLKPDRDLERGVEQFSDFQ